MDENAQFSAEDLAVLNGGSGEMDSGDQAADGDKATGGAQGDAGAEAKTGETGKREGDGKDDGKPAWPSDGFPEDWRDRTVKMLGLDGDALKKAQEVAKRSASPAELLRRVMASDAKIGEVTAELKGRVKIPVGKDVKAEDVAAFQKAWGVPEAPDKYDLSTVGEMQPVDKEIWETVLPGFHKGHFSQAQITEVGKALKTAEAIVAKRMEENAARVDEQTEEALRIEYPGKEYKANIELANRYLEDFLGKYMPEKGERTAFLNMRLADGTRIGSYAPFVRAVVDAARTWAPEGLPETGEGGDAVDPQKEYDELIALAHSTKPEDKRKYEQAQGRLQQLATAINKRNAKR